MVEKISMAITDHMAAKFFGRRDVQGRYERMKYFDKIFFS